MASGAGRTDPAKGSESKAIAVSASTSGAGKMRVLPSLWQGRLR